MVESKQKPRLKFYNDGSLHDEGFNSLKFYERFGIIPLNDQQRRNLFINVLNNFDNALRLN